MNEKSNLPKCDWCKKLCNSGNHNYKRKVKGEIVEDIDFCSVVCMDEYLVSRGRNPTTFDPKRCRTNTKKRTEKGE